MFEEAVTGSGVSIFVTARSAEGTAAALTVVVAVAELFPGVGSAVTDTMVAVLVMMVPPATEPSTATTSVKTLLPVVTEAFVQVIVPVPPTAGVAHDQPAADASETNVVFAGTSSLSETVAAVSGPP